MLEMVKNILKVEIEAFHWDQLTGPWKEKYLAQKMECTKDNLMELSMGRAKDVNLELWKVLQQDIWMDVKMEMELDKKDLLLVMTTEAVKE